MFLIKFILWANKKEYICENGHICLIKFNNFNTITLSQQKESNELVVL